MCIRDSYTNGTIYRNLKNKGRKDTSVKFYKTILSLLCSSDTWPLTRTNEERIQTYEIKMLQRIKGCAKRDRMRNTEIREQLQVASLCDRVKK